MADIKRCPVGIPHPPHGWHDAQFHQCQGTTPAQDTMRSDMQRQQLDEPMSLRAVMEEAHPELSADGLIEQRIQEVALGIIAEHPDLVLSLPVWGHVQAMVEAGIRAGVQLDRDFS